jgi:hypothetical protein|tara:strand:- start:2107 stop:5166 length:3060 start_codon:yes stop_codon:yes gene_type:complete
MAQNPFGDTPLNQITFGDTPIAQQGSFEEQDVGFGENLKRTLVGAARDTAQATTELIEDITGADIPDLPVIPEPTYMGGQAIRDIAGFAAPYTGLLKVASTLSKVNKLSKAKKILDPTSKAGKLGKASLTGVVAEQLAFSPDEERLSNVIQEYAPNEFTEYLMADKDDTASEGRLKMALEGAGLGLALDAAFLGARSIKNKFKKAEEIEQATETPLQIEPKKEPSIIDTETTVAQAKADVIPEGVAPTPKEGFAANVRLSKKAFDEDTENLVKNIAEENEQFWTQRRGRVRFGKKGEVLHEAAMNRGWTVEDVLKLKQGQALNAEDATAIRQIATDAQKELGDITKVYNAKLKSGNLTDVDKIEYTKFLDTVTALSSKEAGVVAEAGRTLRAFREMASHPDEKIRNKARKEYLNSIENTPFDPDVIAKNLEAFEDVDSAINFLGGLKKVKTLDKVQEIWINSLLSSPSTQLVNFLSGILTAALRPAEFYTSALIGAIRQDPKRITFSEANSRLIGSIAGTIEGLKAGSKAFVNPESVVDSMTKLELNRQKSIPGLFGEIVRAPGRLLVATDTGFKTAAYRQEIYGLAMRKARQEGLSGNDAWQRVAQLMKQHSDNPNQSPIGKDVNLKAMDVGRYQTFTRELGTRGKQIQSFINDNPYWRFLLPFVRTPVNIVKYAGERTPLGFMSKEFKEKIAKGGAEKDEVLGRLLFGSSVMTTVGFLAGSGHITGAGPTESNKRTALRATGWRPYSIKINDTYYAYNRFEPVGILFGIAADMQEIGDYVFNESEGNEENQLELDRLASMLMGSVTNNLTNKTFLSGLSSAIQVITDPARYGDRFVQRFTGSFVPTIFAHASQFDDPVLRDARNVTDNFLSRVPLLGYRKELPARRDIFGDIRTADQGLGIGTFSPIRLSAMKNDPVYNELYDLGMYPSMPTRKLRNIELQPKEYEELLSLQKKLKTKERMKRIINTPGYKNLPEFRKKELLDNILKKSQKTARNILFNKNKRIQKEYIKLEKQKFQ